MATPLTAGDYEKTVRKEASKSTHEDMHDAIRRIDLLFGSGYAKTNPTLVGSFMQTTAIERLRQSLLDIAHDRARSKL